MTLLILAAVIAAAILAVVFIYRRNATADGASGFVHGDGRQFTPAPDTNAAAQLGSLSPTERCVLSCMHADIGHPARRIAERSGVPIAEVRAAQRKFKAEGVAAFGPLFDDAAMVGSGYWLTDRGEAMRKEWHRQRMRERIESARSERHALA